MGLRVWVWRLRLKLLGLGLKVHGSAQRELGGISGSRSTMEGSMKICQRESMECYLSQNLNCLKGGYIGDYIEDYYRGH